MKIKGLKNNKQLILFDGVCNLCNSSVLFVIKRDKHNIFMFAPLQSSVGQRIITTFNINTTKTDSILLYNPKTEQLHIKSTAALHIAKQLHGPIKLMALFLIIPARIRNLIYNFIAKNRYKWFGKKDACMLPTTALKAKFYQ